MGSKKTNQSIFDNSDNLTAEIARSNSPTLRIEPESNRKRVSDSDVDIDALLNEPIPETDCEPIQLTEFIKRQYAGYLKIGRQCIAFQYRMGLVLIRQRATKNHGEWESFVEETYDFSIRSARNYMKTAELATEEEALTTPPTELYQDKGIIPYLPRSRPFRGGVTGGAEASVIVLDKSGQLLTVRGDE